MPTNTTPAEAVRLLRTAALTLPEEVGIAVATLIDHCGALERALDLVDNGHQSAMRHRPDNAVHAVGLVRGKGAKKR